MNYASRKARRYAEALFSLAVDAECVDATVAEVARVADLFAALPDLSAVLAHRRIPVDRKLALLASATAGEDGAAGLSELTSHFLRLLVENRRVELLPEIRHALQDKLDQRQGVVRATVTTAVPLLKAEREMIEAKLGSLTGAQRVELEAKVSKPILGGVILHFGGQVVDASVRTYLQTMRETLRRVRVSEFDHEGFLPLDTDKIRAAAR
ncbi:MAG: ATP synthase F1 subunit delta [Fimbriimonadaceae bacterium]|nr:ATP synthase F1 subunit delta [Fimbriimonadaceae bacterium]